MLEREMEDLIAEHPDHFFSRHGFVLQGRQQSFQGIGRFDLLFTDRHGMNVLMELKAVPARYDAIDQVARYRDLLLDQGVKNILMWVVAPVIPPTMREMLSHLGIEFTEISEHEFKRAAKSFGYVLRDSSMGESRPDVLAPVCLDGKWGFIDIAGKFVIPATFANVGRFSEGLASASIVGENGMLGYIDKTGRFVIEPKFDEAGDFSEGLAIARILDEEREEFEWGYVDRKTLKYVREDWCENYQDIRYEDVLNIERKRTEISEGLRPVCAGWFYGYQNEGGQWEIEPQYEMAGRFSEGLAVVRVNDRYGVIDRELNYVVKPQYDLMQDYEEDLAPVRMNNKWGFIDRAGRRAIEPQFDQFGWGFNHGVAIVGVNDRFGIIDRSGRFTLKPRFARIGPFYYGLAAVEDNNGKWGFIDKRGNIAISIHFDGVKRFHSVDDG
ncbi:MAG: endonuclease NucS [Acidobacteriaceae bacterium]|nr:endonuclease NucS [Acidobacteriaceae bacterium]